MAKLRYALWVSSLIYILGCGGGRESAIPVVPPPPAAKITLQEIAQSGSLQGKKERLREELLVVAETDFESPDELLADYEQLVAESNPEAIKAKAAQIAEKL